MLTRPTFLLRATRAFVALVTVWCTGCMGFEPLMNAAMGLSGVRMTCASDVSVTETTTSASDDSVAPTSELIHGSVSAPANEASRSGFSCGCSSCHAVTMSSWMFEGLAAVPADVVHGVVVALHSVARSPLLPPPQFGA